MTEFTDTSAVRVAARAADDEPFCIYSSDPDKILSAAVQQIQPMKRIVPPGDWETLIGTLDATIRSTIATPGESCCVVYHCEEMDATLCEFKAYKATGSSNTAPSIDMVSILERQYPLLLQRQDMNLLGICSEALVELASATRSGYGPGHRLAAVCAMLHAVNTWLKRESVIVIVFGSTQTTPDGDLEIGCNVLAIQYATTPPH